MFKKKKKARGIERERRLKNRRKGSKGGEEKDRSCVGGRGDRRRKLEGGDRGKMGNMRKTVSGKRVGGVAR